MRRYTARLRTSASLSEAQIKAAIESELLRAPITFKLGAVALTEGNVALVEIASGEKRADLVRRLKALESKTSLQLECVGWGWVVSGAAIKSAAEAPSGEHDPNISILAQTEDIREYTLNTRRFVVKQFVGFILIIGFAAIVVLKALGVLNLTLSNLMLAMMFFVLASSDALSIFWTFPMLVSHVRCDPTGIEVKYSLQSSTRRWTWAEIEELDRRAFPSHHVYIIRSKKTWFSIEDFNDESTLIKTILVRASLHFVESSIGRVASTYKRFDAE